MLGVWIAIAMCNQRATDLQNASTRAQCEASRIGGFRALTDIEVRIATELKKYSRMISRTFCLSMHCGFERPPKLATHPSIQCGLGRGNGRVCLKHVARGSMKLGCYGGPIWRYGAPRRVSDSVGDMLGVRRGEPTGSKKPGALNRQARKSRGL